MSKEMNELVLDAMLHGAGGMGAPARMIQSPKKDDPTVSGSLADEGGSTVFEWDVDVKPTPPYTLRITFETINK